MQPTPPIQKRVCKNGKGYHPPHPLPAETVSGRTLFISQGNLTIMTRAFTIGAEYTDLTGMVRMRRAPSLDAFVLFSGTPQEARIIYGQIQELLKKPGQYVIDIPQMFRESIDSNWGH